MIRFALTACALGVATLATAAERLDNLTLAQATQMALQNHRSMQVSQAALDMAEAQYQQAMSAFGPKVGFEAGFQRADENRTFTFAGAIQTPAMDITNTLSGALGPIISTLTPAQQMQIGAAFAQGAGVIPSSTIPMNIEVQMFERDVTKAALNFTYPLYTGGKKEAITGMARAGAEIARQERRKTELEVVRDVNKYYNAVIFAGQMEQLASDTLDRFQALQDLTERLYQGASLKVKKTDYLRSKTTTAITRSMLREANYASQLTREALVNAMGLPLNTAVSLAPEADLPTMTAGLDGLIADAMAFNPDKQRLELAVQAAVHKIDEARSASRPMVGLEASTYQVWNGYDGGLFNDANRKGWTVGIGVKWDLWDAGLTQASVNAAQAGKLKLEAQRVLLDNGLALQIKDDFLRIQRSRGQVQDSTQAQSLAEENRKLHVRAYQEEMVETKDVIEAQIVESFASASLYRARHDLRAAVADLDNRVGRALQPKP